MKPLTGLLVILTALVWLTILIQSITCETRAEYNRRFVLDNTGEVVEIYYKGR
jgi:hypothetical protein